MKKPGAWCGVVALLGLMANHGEAQAAAGPKNEAAPSAVSVESTHVAGTVTMLSGRGGNIGVSVGADGILIVDDQFARVAPQIKKALAKLAKGEPEFVINTHWHQDHTNGNPVFGAAGHIIAHDNVRQRLSTRQEMGTRVTEPLPKVGLPVVTFAQGITLHFNDEKIEVIHFPRGHTDGDSVVLFTGSNVVHMGDLYFAKIFPFIDLDSGGDVLQYAKNVATILDRLKPDTKVIPGHGELSNVAELRGFHAMLVETSELVRSKKAAGKSLAQVQAAGLPQRWRSWSWSFIPTDRWIETLYRGQ